MIIYRDDTRPSLEEARALYRACSLGARRPVDDDVRFAAMQANANLIVTAWDGASLVGISRSLTDFAYCTYLSDLAVHEAYQRSGIGRELIRLTRSAAPLATVILLAAPAAVDYYPHVGFRHHESAWLLSPDARF
jgi:GNAT superfamily N-acetyltransferase